MRGGGGNRPALPLSQLILLGGSSVKLSLMLLHRHRAMIWVCLWGSRVKFQGRGGTLLYRACFVLDCGFAQFFFPGLTPVFQSSVSPSN